MTVSFKKLILVGLILAFNAGLLCSALATPDRSLAAVTGCSEDSHGMAMFGCEDLQLCGSGASSNLRIALRSASPDKVSKSTFRATPVRLSIGDRGSNPLMRAGVGGEGVSVTALKVSARLSNSVLNL